MRIHYKVIGELERKVKVSEGWLHCNDNSAAGALLETLGLEQKGLVIMANGRKIGSEDILKENDQIVIIPVAIGG